MDLAGQAITVAGVVVGAVTAFLVSAAAARAQWRRSLSVRWDQDRLAAYTGYVNAAKVIAQVGLRIVTGKGLAASAAPQSFFPITQERGMELLDEAEARRSGQLEPVLLLGDAKAVTCALALTERLWDLERIARSAEIDIASWDVAFARYRQARVDFYAAARASMGVPAVEFPAGLWSTSSSGPAASRPRHPTQVGH